MRGKFLKRSIASFLLILSMSGNMNCVTYATPPEEESPVEQTEHQRAPTYEEWLEDFEIFKQQTATTLRGFTRIMRYFMIKAQRVRGNYVLQNGQRFLSKEASAERLNTFQFYAWMEYQFDDFYHGLNIMKSKLRLIKTSIQSLDNYYESKASDELKVLYKRDLDDYLNNYLRGALHERILNKLLQINELVVIIKNTAESYKGHTPIEEIGKLMENLSKNICMCYGRSCRLVRGFAGLDLYSYIDKLLNDMDSACNNVIDFQKKIQEICEKD